MDKNIELYKLPKNWGLVNLEDIVLFSKGKKTVLSSHPQNNTVPYLDIAAFEKQQIKQYSYTDKATLIDEKSVAMVWDGARSGLVFKGKGGALGSTLMRITPIIVDEVYIYYFLLFISDYVKSNTKGTGIPHVNPQTLFKVKVPLPPIEEQKRIVSKLEELLSSLDKSKEQLESSVKQMEHYKQSILENIFNKNNLGKSRKLGDLLKFIGSGVTPKGGKGVYKKSGIIFLRSQNIYPNRLELDNVAYISSELHDKMNRTHVQQHDILLNITGASIGRCAYIPSNFKEANVNQHVCILRPNANMVFYKYLSTYLNSPIAQNIIMKAQTGATRQGLNYSQIKNIDILVPNIESQKAMVQTFEEKKSVCDKTEEIITHGIIQVEILKQTILKKAFEGYLVERDISDESVIQLVERIKAEKKQLIFQEKEKKNKLPKFIVMQEKMKSILEILKENATPMPSKQLWQLSDMKDDIDGFYAELKKYVESGEIIEMPRVGKESFLKLSELK